MISFNNTEIAFKHKTNADLRRANFLFSVMASPGMIKATIFKQFCGGETIEECTPTINSMWKNHVGTILDYSVEGKESPEDFEATTNEIIATITKAKNNEGIQFAVFKVTGIAEFAILEKANASESDLSETEKATYNLVVERVNRICKAAYESHVPVFIDAEETWIQDTIDRICHQMMELYNKEKAIVYNTVQMYRHDRLAFL